MAFDLLVPDTYKDIMQTIGSTSEAVAKGNWEKRMLKHALNPVLTSLKSGRARVRCIGFITLTLNNTILEDTP